VLAGNETPEDVAAIMSWFYDDPQRLGDAVPRLISGGSNDSNVSDDETAVVAVAELSIGNTAILPARRLHEISADRNWSRFINHVFMAFREKRGPFVTTNTADNGEDEGGEDVADSDTGADDPAIERSLSVFDQLFDLLLSSEGTSRNA